MSIRGNNLYEYGKFDVEHLLLMEKGITLYNESYYYECHEELEDLWMDASNENVKYVYWALIQVSTSLYHLGIQNLKGANEMLRKSKRKFKEVENLKVYSELLEFNMSWGRFKETVCSIPDDSEAIAFKKLTEFKFKNPKDWKLKYE